MNRIKQFKESVKQMEVLNFFLMICVIIMIMICFVAYGVTGELKGLTSECILNTLIVLGIWGVLSLANKAL